MGWAGRRRLEPLSLFARSRLKTYLPRNRDLAEIEIARLAEYKRQPKVQRESNFQQ